MNDILEIMPEMIMGRELDDKLRILPQYNESIREKSITERLIALQNIYQIFIPNTMSREIYCHLYLALLRSLQKKQSIFAVRQFNENSKMIRQKSYESIIGASDSSTILGPSGIGKSSAVSRAINTLTEVPVLQLGHTNIITCLQVQLDASLSIKGLYLEILRKTDEMLHTKYHENALKSRATSSMLQASISQVCLNHIGLLIIDEVEYVVNSKNSKAIIAGLTQLINNSGVSIVFVGTSESQIFFEQEMILARRALGLQYTSMEYGEEFRKFCQILLGYCYVLQKPTVDESLLMWLYNHSAGNTSIIVGLIYHAQQIAILQGMERLDISTLNMAFEKRMTMLHDFIRPEPIKMTQIERKAKDVPKVVDEACIVDGLSIYQIAMTAKEFQNDIVCELKRKGITVLEVKL